MSVVIGQQHQTSRLHILSGIHQGAVAALDSHTAHQIGSGTDADIRLRDEGIAVRHVTLDIDAGRARLTSHAGQVQIERRPALRPGDVYESRLPFTFTVGAVRMRIAGDRQEKKIAGGLGAKAALPALLVLFCSLLFALLYIPGMASETRFQPDAGAIPRTAPAFALPVVRQELHRRMVSAGLGNLDIQAAAGQINVSGEVSVSAREQWHDIQVWFDRTYGASYLLRANLTLAQAPELFIKAIWLGKGPYIVAENGERRYPGAVMADGWVLEKIGRHELVLARSGRQHVLRY